MSQLETMIRDAAAPDAWTADWDDVLRRAGHSRYRSRRAAAIVAVAAVGVVLLLPGIGIGGGLNAILSGSSGPGLELRGALSVHGRAIGSVSFRTTRAFVAVAPKSGRVGIPIAKPELRWSLRIARGIKVSSLRIVRDGRVAIRLCAPCADGATGRFRVSRLTFSAVFGRGTAVAKTNVGSARGKLRLQKPQR